MLFVNVYILLLYKNLICSFKAQISDSGWLLINRFVDLQQKALWLWSGFVLKNYWLKKNFVSSVKSLSVRFRRKRGWIEPHCQKCKVRQWGIQQRRMRSIHCVNTFVARLAIWWFTSMMIKSNLRMINVLNRLNIFAIVFIMVNKTCCQYRWWASRSNRFWYRNLKLFINPSFCLVFW